MEFFYSVKENMVNSRVNKVKQHKIITFENLNKF